MTHYGVKNEMVTKMSVFKWTEVIELILSFKSVSSSSRGKPNTFANKTSLWDA